MNNVCKHVDIKKYINIYEIGLSIYKQENAAGCWLYSMRNVYAHVETGISNQNPTLLFIVNIPETREKETMNSILTTFHV